MHQSELIEKDISAYLEQHRTKELLRFLTCGSVDDGKSTLIGRLLHDTKMIYEDQLAAAEKDSSTEEVDLSLLVDGLRAEREQGITIDVAYRYFSTAKRKFIIADCPGHEQYTRNMATGASTCDLAVILIDARKGVLPQTKRHSFIVSLLGIKHVIVAVNKMDLVDYSERVYEEICSDYRDFAAKLDLQDVQYVPLSALKGDNVVDPSEAMSSWYKGATMMHLLEKTHIASDRNLIDLRMPIQYVIRPNLDFRGYAGTIASGVLKKGDEVVVLPSGKKSKVKGIHTYDGEIEKAFPPLSVVVTLEDEVDISRGEMLCAPNNRPRVEESHEAMVVWMNEAPAVPGKEYLIKHTSRVSPASIDTIRYAVDVNTLHREPSAALDLNQIGRCKISTRQPIFTDAYRKNRTTGAFIIIDRLTNNTVGAGMIVDRRSEKKDYWDAEAPGTLEKSESPLSLEEKEKRFGQKAVTLLLTGLSGSGKTSLIYALERKLFERGRAMGVLDGENLRGGLSKDVGFDADGRSESLRRAVETAELFNKTGLIAGIAMVAPSASLRAQARDALGGERFVLVHVDCPVEVCRERDKRGLYRAADAGELSNMPGVDVAYEAPTDPDLVVDSVAQSADENATRILELLESKGFIR